VSERMTNIVLLVWESPAFRHGEDVKYGEYQREIKE